MCGYFEHTGAKCNAYSEVRLSSVLGWGAGGGAGGRGKLEDTKTSSTSSIV